MHGRAWGGLRRVGSVAARRGSMWWRTWGRFGALRNGLGGAANGQQQQQQHSAVLTGALRAALCTRTRVQALRVHTRRVLASCSGLADPEYYAGIPVKRHQHASARGHAHSRTDSRDAWSSSFRRGFHSGPASSWAPYRHHRVEENDQEERHGRVPVEHFEAEERSHPNKPVPGEVVAVPEETTNTVKAAFVGNLLITILKFSMWLKTGSSAMFSEAMHTLVDVGNQAFLLLGLRQASMAADTNFQYGYGRAAFFWSLVSALGMFWMGSCVSLFHGVSHLVAPMPHISVGWETWAVLGFSFAVDGVVFAKAFNELKKRAEADELPMLRYLINMKDPFLLAVLLEDFSGTVGVLLAAAGIGMTQLTGCVVWDSLASIAIGGLLGGVALTLVRTNQRFLLGQSVEKEITADIQQLILSRPAVERVYEVQSQWLGPASFSYKAEIDFDGSNLAAQLHSSYANEFFESEDLRKDLPVLLSCYAEDVTRLVEREVKTIEALIRQKYPEAAFIELEPDSYYTFRRKIDDMRDVTLYKYERNIMLQQLNSILAQQVQHQTPTTVGSVEAQAFLQRGFAPTSRTMPAETMVQVLQVMRRRNRNKNLRSLTRNVKEQGRAAAQAGDAYDRSDSSTAAHFVAQDRRHSRVTKGAGRTVFDTMSHPLMVESPMMLGMVAHAEEQDTATTHDERDRHSSTPSPLGGTFEWSDDADGGRDTNEGQ